MNKFSDDDDDDDDDDDGVNDDDDDGNRREIIACKCPSIRKIIGILSTGNGFG